MDTVADYEAWKAKQRKSGVGAAAMVLGSVDTAPDQLAGDLQLATEFGKVTGNPVPPAPMVQEYRSVFQQAIEKTRAETILSSSPRLTEWLRNPENATLARDDLDGLSWWETGLGAAGNSVKRAALSVPQTYNRAMAEKFSGDAADLQRGFGDLVYDEREPVFKDGKEVARLWATPTDVLGAAWRWGTSRWSGLVTDPAADAAAYEMRAAELQGRIAGMAMSPGAQAIREKLGTVSGTWQEQLSQFGALIAEDPLGFASFIGQVGLESAPAIGLSTAVGVATRSPTAAAATMGALSGAREYGASAGDVVAQSGYDLSTFEGAMAAISDEDLMRRAGETGQVRGIIIGALDGLSGGLAGKVLSESPVGNMLLQTVTQALFGSGGEAAATYAAGQDFNLANVLIEGIAEAFTAPIEVGGMAVAKVRQMQAQARDAEGRVALFQELSGQAVASKLRARMPDRFRQFVDQATQNGPVENVFVPAQDFVQYFQTAGIDPYALVDELDGVSRDDLDAALAGGGDLKIPTATYAAKIAGSEHDAFLMENMRFDPLDMTAKEAADFNARVDDVMQEMWAEAEDIRQDEERWRAVEEKIHDTVVSQMRAAGLSTERAMAEVQPIVAFYRTRAARMGLTTEEYLAKHPLPGIQGAIPQGMQFKNVDDLNRTLAEARNRRAPAVDTRQSLLEFISDYGGINDVGGELKARDAVAVTRRGKSTLKLAREGMAGQGSMLGPSVGGKRFGADDVAQAAIDAGFMADNPLVMEYRAAAADGRETPDLTAALWDAIDAELAGQKQASVQDAAPVDDAYLDEIEQYLNRLGLDLSNTDEEIRAAIEADQSGADRMYGQDGQIATESAAFKAWFGDSKVVDADGKPLVVYHGTDQDISEFSTDGGKGKTYGTGAFFSSNPSTASTYAASNGGNVSAVYLSLKAPMVIDAGGANWNRLGGKVKVRLPEVSAMSSQEDEDLLAALFDAKPEKAKAKTVKAKNTTLKKLFPGELDYSDDFASTDDMARWARANGYDGLIVNNVMDRGPNGIHARDEAAVPSTVFVAFAPTQIKSVNNRGTFDANDPRILFQFAGPQSETADIHALATAKDRVAAGANEEVVRRETGWFRGPDLKWRYEITDEDAKLVAFANDLPDGDEVELGKILSHPRLFAAYPDLAMIPVKIDNALDAWGQVNGYGSEMILNVARIKAEGGADALISTLLHEIQHLIQRREGFARGGNQAMSKQVKDALTKLTQERRRRVGEFENTNWMDFKNADQARRMVGYASMYQDFNRLIDYARMDRPSGVFRHIRNATQWLHTPVMRDDAGLSSEAMDLYRSLYALPRSGSKRNAFLQQYAFDLAQLIRKAVPEDRWQLLADDPRKTASLLKALERESAKASAKLKPYQVLKDQARLAEAQSDKARYASPFEIYQLLAGEVEARNTENRMRMTEAERAATSPDATMTADRMDGRARISTDDVIVVLQTGEITSPFVANSEGNYRGTHTAPSAEDGVPASDVTGDVYPEDFYGPNGFRYYADFGKPYDRKTYNLVKSLRGKPDALVTIYRAVPKGVATINPGDWVGITREYAVDHGDANLGGEYDILEMRVPSRDLFTNGDSLDEWGWSPMGRSYMQANSSAPQFFQNQSGPRGQISFNMDGSSLIRLFETANLSTVQHELGHLFLTMLQRDAADGDQATVAEYENVKSWWRSNAAAVAADGNRAMPDAKITAEDVQRAIDTGTTGDVIKDAAVDVGMQEQWARGYEAYLMEGKSPSVELGSVFAKFRSWMISVYKSLTGLNVKITPEIRGVFDRMLATDEEIAKAQVSSGETRGLFTTAEQMGLTEEEFARFVKLRVQAEDEAKARLQVEIMEPIRRETEKWWKDERARVTEETERRVNAMPVFRAMEWLGNRRWLGDGQPEAMPDMRMSKQVLVDRYGDGVLKTLPRGMQTVYAVEGGMNPDDVAGWFGFDSGDQMIRAMERAPKRGDAIKAEVDAEMYRRHGDPLKDGEIERRALDALHSDRRGEWLAAELKSVADVAGVDVKMTVKDARASARQTVARMKVRDALAANRFLAAERKAGEEAARLAMMLGREGVWMQNARRRIATKSRAALRDDATVDAVAAQIDQANKSTGNYNETVQRLIEAKRRQLINHALFMEARAVADEVAKAERFVQKLNKASMRERIAGAGRRDNAQTDYLAALDEIQDRYDFRKLSGRAETRMGALVAFVDAMKAAGRENELAVPEAVLRAANRTPYKTLTVEELRGVVDSLKNIQHIALRWNDLIDAQNQRKLDEAVAEITEAMDANLPKRPPGRVKTAGEGFRNSARQFIDLVLNASTLLREIDGFKDAGAAYRNLKEPIDQAMDRLTVRKEKAAAEMEALYAVYSKEDRRRMAVREYVPALGYSLSKWEKIAVALNTGNEGNMQRLTDPKVRGSLTEAQVRAVLASLDERDAGFIQSVWDFVGSFREDIAARERRTTGVEPAWVDASPVQIGGKELRGGYYPLKYDARLSSLARDDEAQAIGEALQAGRFGKAQTKRGHLEARAKSSGRDVELDMSVFHRHVNQVIYDLELSEPVANSWKVLQSGPVRQAFMDAGRQADFDALETWLKDVAEGQLAAGDWINKNARRFKSNFTAAKLAFNLGTVAAQVTGLSQTIVVVGKRDFLLGLQASFRAGVGDEIAAKSPFMRQRQTTFNKDVMDFYDDPSLGPTASRWGEIKREWIGPASFWLMTKVQWLLVDIPTWLGGYQQGLRLYANDEAKAVAHADGIVKRAQSSGLFSDRSAIERGSVSRTTRQNDVVRLFTTLGSYMFAKFNVAYERAAVGGRVIRKEGLSVRSVQEAASLTLDMAFLFTLEAVVMAAIKGRLPDDEDEEDAGWAAFLAKETAFSVLGTIPFVRDVASFGQGFEGGGAYGGIISELGKPFIEVSQGDIDKGLVKSIISTTGLFTGLPASQINRAVDAAWRQVEGDDVAPVEYLLGKR